MTKSQDDRVLAALREANAAAEHDMPEPVRNLIQQALYRAFAVIKAKQALAAGL